MEVVISAGLQGNKRSSPGEGGAICLSSTTLTPTSLQQLINTTVEKVLCRL